MTTVIHKKNSYILRKLAFWAIINLGILGPFYIVSAATTLKSPLEGAGIKTAGDLIKALVNIIVRIGVPVAGFFMVYSGLLFVTARGDQGQLDRAKDNFWYTILGTAIILGAKIISDTIAATISSLK